VEVLSLSAGNVDMDRRVATVQHKTQRLTGRPREVPLSKPAIRLLRQLDPAGFTLTVPVRTLYFGKRRERC